jgi:hypothetical protein
MRRKCIAYMVHSKGVIEGPAPTGPAVGEANDL